MVFINDINIKETDNDMDITVWMLTSYVKRNKKYKIDYEWGS